MRRWHLVLVLAMLALALPGVTQARSRLAAEYEGSAMFYYDPETGPSTGRIFTISPAVGAYSSYLKLSDALGFYFGTDKDSYIAFDATSANLRIYNTGASGEIDLFPNADVDNYIQFLTATNVPGISFVGDGSITATGGDISFGDDNLSTTGSASVGSVTLTTPLGVASGGTGAGTHTDGGVLIGKGTSAFQNTGVLADGTIIIGDGATNPTTLAAFSSSTGTLKVANGGTGLASGTSGGVLAFTASGTLASSAALTANAIVLGGGAGAAPAALGSLGTTTTLLHGNASGTPSFSAVSLTADVSGILPVANGGTGVSALTAYNVVLGGTTANLAAPSATVGVPLISAGSSANPAFGALPLGTSGVVSGILPIAYGGTGVSDLAGSGAVILNAGVMTSEATLAVARGGTGLASGTSGGVLAYTAAGTLASSGALTANALVLGGGAGAVPATMGSLGTTTTLLHGNAGGAPTFSAVSLTADVSGILPFANGGTGSADISTAGPVFVSGTEMTSEAQLAVSRGGTGASSLTDGGVLLGSGSGAITAMSALADGSIIVGDGTTDPVALAAFTSSTGVLKVANGGTGLVSGTSGGILAYTADGTLASSALLTANAILLGGGAGAAPAALGSLGTTATVLHGNAAGAPSFSAVSLTADVSGILPVANGGTGVSDLAGSGALFLNAGVMTSEAQLDVTRGGTGVATLAQYGILVGNAANDVQVVAASANTGAPLLSAGASANPAYGALNLAGGATIVSGILPIANGGTGVSDLAGSGAVILNAGVMTSEATLGVARGGTGLASGTSGGILAYTADGTLASSALLTANAIMLGGGAGAAPSVVGSLGTTATVLHGNAGGAPSFSAVSLTADVSGILPVANGGTGVGDLAGDGALFLTGGVMTSEAQLSVSRGGSGAATFTDHGVLVGSGASAFTALSAGSDFEVLCGSTSNDPGFRALTDGDIPAAITLSGGTIENSPIGASTANTGRFTTCTATSKFSGSEIENSGNITIDAVNAGAASEVYVLNSDGSQVANFNIEGDLVLSGHIAGQISIQTAFQAADMDWTYNGSNACWKLAGGGGKLEDKVIHVRLNDLVVGEEITGWRIEGMCGATGGATVEVDACMYKVAAASTDPSAVMVGSAMTQVDVAEDTKLDNGVTFAAETVAAETEYYVAITGSVDNGAGYDIQLNCLEVDLNRK